jgi:hypothetical protein
MQRLRRTYGRIVSTNIAVSTRHMGRNDQEALLVDCSFDDLVNRRLARNLVGKKVFIAFRA